MENTQTQSELPQLSTIAAILGGLLASGDYTDGPESFSPFDRKKKNRANYRPEAVNDAIELAVRLQAAVKLMGPAPKPLEMQPAAS